MRELTTLVHQDIYLDRNGNPLIQMKGPFGAPSQEFIRYSELLLISAGMGATPFSSILKSLIDARQYSRVYNNFVIFFYKSHCSPLKVTFWWTTRSYEKFQWFLKTLAKLSGRNLVCEIKLFQTSPDPETRRKFRTLRLRLLLKFLNLDELLDDLDTKYDSTLRKHSEIFRPRFGFLLTEYVPLFFLFIVSTFLGQNPSRKEDRSILLRTSIYEPILIG